MSFTVSFYRTQPGPAGRSTLIRLPTRWRMQSRTNRTVLMSLPAASSRSQSSYRFPGKIAAPHGDDYTRRLDGFDGQDLSGLVLRCRCPRCSEQHQSRFDDNICWVSREASGAEAPTR